MPKTKAFKPNQKAFLKLMTKRDSFQRVITRNQKKLQKVDSQLAQYADWLKSLTASK